MLPVSEHNTITMGYLKRIATFRIARFGLAGAVNTATNFITLNIAIYALHLGRLTSAVIATSCAIGVSFLLNRGFVFLDKAHPGKKLVRFIMVSVAGVLLIQDSVYAICLALLHGREGSVGSVLQRVTTLSFSSSFIGINLSNSIASFVVMFWNYNGYKLTVFKDAKRSNDAIEDISTEAA